MSRPDDGEVEGTERCAGGVKRRSAEGVAFVKVWKNCQKNKRAQKFIRQFE